MSPTTTGHFTIVLLPEAEGGFAVVCAALPGCISQGETVDEAVQNIIQAIEAWQAREGPVDEDDPQFVIDEIAALLSDRVQAAAPLTIETRVVEVVLPVFTRAQRRRRQRQDQRGELPLYLPPPAPSVVARGQGMKVGVLMALIRQAGSTVGEYLAELAESDQLPEGMDRDELRRALEDMKP